MNKGQAVKLTRRGALVALLVTLCSWALISYAIRNDASGTLASLNNESNYYDVILGVLLACGMYFQSRLASVLMLLSYGVDRIIFIYDPGNTVTDGTIGSPVGLALAAVVLYFLCQAVYASFIYHRIKRQQNPSKRSSKWIYAFTIPVALTIGFIYVLGAGSSIGAFPSTRVLVDSQIRDKDITLLRENKIVSARETVTHFYSEGLFSILEGGNVLTQRRVVSYYTDEYGELVINDIDLVDITDVQTISVGDSLEDGHYRVYSSVTENWLEILLSREQKGDTLFLKELRNHVPQNAVYNL